MSGQKQQLRRQVDRAIYRYGCCESRVASRLKLPPYHQLAMADAILDQVNVSSMFDLRGTVAVVTGGGTVSDCPVHCVKRNG